MPDQTNPPSPVSGEPRYGIDVPADQAPPGPSCGPDAGERDHDGLRLHVAQMRPGDPSTWQVCPEGTVGAVRVMTVAAHEASAKARNDLYREVTTELAAEREKRELLGRIVDAHERRHDALSKVNGKALRGHPVGTLREQAQIASDDLDALQARLASLDADRPEGSDAGIDTVARPEDHQGDDDRPCSVNWGEPGRGSVQFTREGDLVVEVEGGYDSVPLPWARKLTIPQAHRLAVAAMWAPPLPDRSRSARLVGILRSVARDRDAFTRDALAELLCDAADALAGPTDVGADPPPANAGPSGVGRGVLVGRVARIIGECEGMGTSQRRLIAAERIVDALAGAVSSRGSNPTAVTLTKSHARCCWDAEASWAPGACGSAATREGAVLDLIGRLHPVAGFSEGAIARVADTLGAMYLGSGEPVDECGLVAHVLHEIGAVSSLPGEPSEEAKRAARAASARNNQSRASAIDDAVSAAYAVDRSPDVDHALLRDVADAAASNGFMGEMPDELRDRLERWVDRSPGRGGGDAALVGEIAGLRAELQVMGGAYRASIEDCESLRNDLAALKARPGCSGPLLGILRARDEALAEVERLKRYVDALATPTKRVDDSDWWKSLGAGEQLAHMTRARDSLQERSRELGGELDRLRAAKPLTTETLREPPDELLREVERVSDAEYLRAHSENRDFSLARSYLLGLADWLDSQPSTGDGEPSRDEMVDALRRAKAGEVEDVEGIRQRAELVERHRDPGLRPEELRREETD